MGEKNKEQASMVRDLTSGSVTKQILIFAMPLFVANALQAIYNLVDMVVVGQVIGGTGMSAVSIGGDVLHLLTFLAMGFASAGQVIISQYVGARKHHLISKMIGTMFTFLFAISIIMSVSCYLLRYQILSILNTPSESYTYTMDYMVICIFGLIFIYGYNIVSAILRGMGDSRRPFVFIAIAAVINTVLDIFFVAFCHMGVAGAALATVIGQGASFVISIFYLYRRKEEFGFDFKRESFRISGEVLKPLLVLGIPMAIQSAAINISKIVLTAWINAEGVVYSALAGIYNKSALMMGIVSNSFTTAGSSMTGQSIGAEKYDRVPRILQVVLTIGLAIAIVVSVLLYCFPDVVCSMFTSDRDVLAKASLVVMPVILNFFGCATRSGAFSLINGSGNSRLNLLVALIDGVIGRIGLAALFGFVLNWRSVGFWYGDAVAGFAPILIGTVFFFSGRWKKGAQ